jgi:hypothetical protein
VSILKLKMLEINLHFILQLRRRIRIFYGFLSPWQRENDTRKGHQILARHLPRNILHSRYTRFQALLYHPPPDLLSSSFAFLISLSISVYISVYLSNSWSTLYLFLIPGTFYIPNLPDCRPLHSSLSSSLSYSLALSLSPYHSLYLSWSQSISPTLS